MTQQWDRTVDILVAGTGAAALSAAITAKESGLEVLIVESSDKWGGTTMMSGGGLWMPNNPLMQRDGAQDSRADALTYMDDVIERAGDPGPASSQARREAFVDGVGPVTEMLGRLGVRWARAKDYPDYYPDRPGGRIGRGIEALPFDAKRLGDWYLKSRYKQSIPASMRTDDVWLVFRGFSTWSGFWRGFLVVMRTLGAYITGKKPFGIGAALSMSYMLIVREQGTEILLSSPLTELIKDGEEVVGAVVTTPDGPVRVRATAGVILGAGGFAHKTEWREKYQGVPGYSSASDGDLGTGIEAGHAVGGALALMDDAWWGASGDWKAENYPFLVSDRSYPFSMIVDQSGQRYVNESESYVDFGHEMIERNKTVPAIPSWLILDKRNQRRYIASSTLTGRKEKIAAGVIVLADTIEELATKLKIDPTVLRATTDRFNSFAKPGVDLDFGRGRTAYDNYYGDPRVKPNNNLGTLEKGPFLALRIVPGDLGTKGGLLTDEHARVLTEQGAVIPGLYAAGNTTASVMGHTYPGPGSTIAPATVFGYLAARHAAETRAAASQAEAPATTKETV